MMIKIKYLLILGTLLANFSCQTTDNKGPATKSLSAKRPIAKVSFQTGSLELESDESQKIYLKMLAIELSAGIKVKKNHLHSSRGTMQCHRDGVLESCFFRVRVIGDELSSTQPVDKALGQQIWSYIRKQRTDLKSEKVVLTDLVCDYIGKKSPPFNQETVNCKMKHPRAANEAVFVSKAAEELSESLRGNIEFTNKKVTLNGTVACQWIDESERTPCMARLVNNGALTDDVLELSQKVSKPIAKRMMQTLQDYYSMKRGSRSFVAPKEIMGSVTCVVDSLNFMTSHNRRYSCRVRI
jgi:hypothetical protein